jgi:hypothetical protein
MSKEISAAENRDAEYKLLLEERDSLQLRLRNYTNIQQKLISANQIIDKKLDNLYEFYKQKMGDKKNEANIKVDKNNSTQVILKRKISVKFYDQHREPISV